MLERGFFLRLLQMVSDLFFGTALQGLLFLKLRRWEKDPLEGGALPLVPASFAGSIGNVFKFA